MKWEGGARNFQLVFTMHSSVHAVQLVVVTIFAHHCTIVMISLYSVIRLQRAPLVCHNVAHSAICTGHICISGVSSLFYSMSEMHRLIIALEWSVDSKCQNVRRIYTRSQYDHKEDLTNAIECHAKLFSSTALLILPESFIRPCQIKNSFS